MRFARADVLDRRVASPGVTSKRQRAAIRRAIATLLKSDLLSLATRAELERLAEHLDREAEASS